MFVFRAREAHAWVEVKVPGYGWAVMEPTPPVFLEGGGVPRRADAGELPPSRDEIPMTEEGSVTAPGAHVGRVALGMMTAFGVLAIIAFIAKAIRHPVESVGFAALGKDGTKAGYFRAWAKACEERGLKWPGGTTLKSRLDMMEIMPDFGDELLRYHYGVMYEGADSRP